MSTQSLQLNSDWKGGFLAFAEAAEGRYPKKDVYAVIRGFSSRRSKDPMEIKTRLYIRSFQAQGDDLMLHAEVARVLERAIQQSPDIS